MAAALERKLARIAGKDPRDMQTLAEEAAKAKAATEEDWDLEGRMTPGKMTPREGNAEIAKQALEMTGSVEAAINEAMEHARGRHRKSISKAADILESAGFDGENVTFDDASSKMKLVEQAMADARQRHRRSIDRAMMQLE